MGHNREYTAMKVANFVASIGFKIEKIIYRDGYKNIYANSLLKPISSLNSYYSVISRKICVSDKGQTAT